MFGYNEKLEQMVGSGFVYGFIISLAKNKHNDNRHCRYVLLCSKYCTVLQLKKMAPSMLFYAINGTITSETVMASTIVESNHNNLLFSLASVPINNGTNSVTVETPIVILNPGLG